MSLLLIFVFLLLLWVFHRLLKGYEDLRTELQEIRIKCVSSPALPSHPIADMKQTVIEKLEALKKI